MPNGNPSIMRLEGQIMAHRTVIVSLIQILRGVEVLPQNALSLLDQHLLASANSNLDAVREFRGEGQQPDDGDHLAVAFDEEIQKILGLLSAKEN